ncbi:MAG: ThiF family adenylyltransferase [Oscillospiraceae bacterium]
MAGSLWWTMTPQALTHLNRRYSASLHSTLGQYKAQVMADRVRDIHPDCQVRAINRLYTEEDKADFFDVPYDYIVDAIDLVSCKLSLIAHAHHLGIPIISALGTGNKLDPTAFRVADINQTSVCPLARVVRRELKARGILHHKVLFSTEPALTPAPLTLPAGPPRTYPRLRFFGFPPAPDSAAGWRRGFWIPRRA